MQQDKKAKRLIPISWRKIIPGVVLLAIGAMVGAIYFLDRTNIFAGMVTALAIASGGFLIYRGIKMAESGFSFEQKKSTGRENTIIVFARRGLNASKDVPIIIKFVELKHPPKSARLHYVRNLKKHYYEIFNNTGDKILEPVKLPDKKSFPPELFKIPAVMQTYKDAIEYSPPTMLQKIAPGILLLAMGLVGILMVMTGG